jgi:hypothetical protein
VFKLSDEMKRKIIAGEFVESYTFNMRDPYVLQGEAQMNALPVPDAPAEKITVIRLTRRQVQVLKLLDDGAVLEPIRLKNTKAKRVPRNYIMRPAGSHETDGVVVKGTTVRALLSQGFAIRVEYRHAGIVWVFSQAYYLRRHTNG